MIEPLRSHLSKHRSAVASPPFHVAATFGHSPIAAPFLAWVATYCVFAVDAKDVYNRSALCFAI
jgi:hypothetical protein